jgi:signal transduction histidine kinase
MMSPFVVALREALAILTSTPTVEPGEAAVARRLIRELTQSIERLEGRPSDKDLISIVCHDLKDPLASIVMGAGFLRKTISADDGAARRVVEAIGRSADRLGQVVGDFHDLAKLENHTLPVDPRACDLGIALRAAVGPFETQARAKGVAFDLEVPAAPLTVLVDHSRLSQIVGKLLDNALKFTPAGGRVVVRVERGGSAARLQVVDTGRGIAPDQLGSVFDHAANARRSPRDGPGLGLAIVKGLLELQGGTVTIESRENEGTTVAVTLPYAT